MPDYRVNLDIYSGPMDLLLYLIRRDEVDIHDIPIARITEQYLHHVDMLQQLDPDVAGEFLVLAATLLEIKTRMLLPAPAAEEVAQDLALDPRAELVRQLLQYKAFKDAAADLHESAEERARRFARRPAAPEGDAADVDLEDAQVWDLLDAFSKLLESIGHRPTHQQVIYDDTPVELHQADLLDRLRREGPLRFGDVFAGRSRGEMVGLFLALLELIRLRKVVAIQEKVFGEIHVYLSPPEPAPGPADGAAAAQPAAVGATGAQSEAGGAPRAGTLDAGGASPPDSAPAPDSAPQTRPEGQYASDVSPSENLENEDERGTEDQGTGV